MLHIPQSSSITGDSPSDCLVSYPGHSLGGVTPLQKCSRCILQPQPTGQNKKKKNIEVLSYKVSLSDSESASICVTCRSELFRTLRKGKVLWPPGHTIMRTWLSLFPGHRSVASINIYWPVQCDHRSVLSYSPSYFSSTSWMLDWDCRASKCC